MFRYLRAFLYLITGRIDAARRALSKNTYVIQATYDNAIEQSKRKVAELSEAFAAISSQEAQKVARLKVLSEEANKAERLKSGAIARAKEVTASLQGQGLTPEQVKTNPEYIKCLSSYQDFSAKAETVLKQIKELEENLKEHRVNSEKFKTTLIDQKRRIEDLKNEKNETTADILMAEEEKKVNQMLSGISTDSSSKDIEEMREIRQKAKAEAKVSRELAGTEIKSVENEFLSYADKDKSSADFDNLVGLGTPAQDVVKLPEA